MKLKIKVKLLLVVLLMGMVAVPNAMCMDRWEEYEDAFSPAWYDSFEIKKEEAPFGVPWYSVSDAKRIYCDLLKVDSDKRQEFLQEIIRQSDKEYTASMASCSQELADDCRGLLHETLSFICNNRDEHKSNLLHYAAYHGRFDIFLDIKRCLGDRFDAPKEDYYMMLDMQNVYGDTPLHYAVASGNVELVKYILETIFMRKSHISPESRCVSKACVIQNNVGHTPLELAKYLCCITIQPQKKESYTRIINLFRLFH